VARADRPPVLLERAGTRLQISDAKSVSFYAGDLGVARTQINRVCHAVSGRSAPGAINARLRHEAARDPVYSLIDVREIALSLGFSDAACFSRFFSKHICPYYHYSGG
jgi:AraC family transcriptional activator of pobA